MTEDDRPALLERLRATGATEVLLRDFVGAPLEQLAALVGFLALPGREPEIRPVEAPEAAPAPEPPGGLDTPLKPFRIASVAFKASGVPSAPMITDR